MSGRNDFLPGSARSVLTAELMASPDVKVRRSNKELFGERVACIFSRCRILHSFDFPSDIVPLATLAVKNCGYLFPDQWKALAGGITLLPHFIALHVHA